MELEHYLDTGFALYILFDRLLRKREAREEKAAQKSRGEVDKLWSAKKIHELLGKGFFKEPHTSKEVFLKLNPAIKDKEEIKKYSIEIGKITASLSSGKFAVLLEKLPPLEGEASVRFVEKRNNQPIFFGFSVKRISRIRKLHQ